jgi:hypothetical protein
MLVLTRKPDQSIMIGDEIEITVLAIGTERVRTDRHPGTAGDPGLSQGGLPQHPG